MEEQIRIPVAIDSFNFKRRDNITAISKKLFCGGCAGVCGVILGQPLDLIKTKMQTSTKIYRSAYSCFLDIVQNGGYQSFYKGMTAPLCSQFFQSGLMFTGENIAMSYLEPNISLNDNINGSTRAAHSFLSGSFGGLLKCVVLVPADLIKCKLQVDKGTYKGSFDCISKVFKNQGFNGLYTGFTASAMREIPSFGVFFFGVPTIIEHIEFFNQEISDTYQYSQQ